MTLEKIKSRTAKILVAEGSDSVRLTYLSIFKHLGYEDVKGVARAKDALDVLQVEVVDWIVMAPKPEEHVNALQILELISRTPALYHIFCSFLMDAEDTAVLNKAFEFGLFSFHPRHMVPDQITSEFDVFIRKIQKNKDWTSRDVAADYARTHFRQAKLFEELLRLETALVDAGANDPKQLLLLAEAEICAGKKDAGIQRLMNVQLGFPEFSSTVKEVEKKLSVSTNSGAGDVGLRKLVSGNEIFVVEPESQGPEIQGQLGAMGLSGSMRAFTFQQAFKMLEEATKLPPKLLFVSTKTTGGVQLLLKFLRKLIDVRHLQPYIVIAGDEKELSSIHPSHWREVGVLRLIKSPVEQAALVREVMNFHRQTIHGSNADYLELRVRRALRRGDLDGAKSVVARIDRNKQFPHGMRLLIQSQIFYATRDYKDAAQAAADALELYADPVQCLNVLGKSFMQLGSFDIASKCFSQAQERVPDSAERLCDYSVVLNEVGKKDEAKTAIDQAEDLAPGDDCVNEARAVIGMRNGDLEAARDALRQIGSAAAFIAQVNNMAIALTRSGRSESGRGMYQQALTLMQGIGNGGLEAAVRYNLALNYIREGNDFDLAAGELKKAIDSKAHKRVVAKAKSLRKRLMAAMNSGSPFSINEDLEERTEVMGDRLSGVAKRGLGLIMDTGKCLLKIYKFEGLIAPKVAAMLAKRVEFVARGVIMRGMTHGLDRLNKVE